MLYAILGAITVLSLVAALYFRGKVPAVADPAPLNQALSTLATKEAESVAQDAKKAAAVLSAVDAAKFLRDSLPSTTPGAVPPSAKAHAPRFVAGFGRSRSVIVG